MALHYQEHEPLQGGLDQRAMQNLPTSTTVSTIAEDEAAADVDEPPDDRRNSSRRPWSCDFTPVISAHFEKERQPRFWRRESLLTQQLHFSETEAHTEDERRRSSAIPRGMSTTSTCSNPSVASTAELTSDDGITSPTTRASTPSPHSPSLNFNGLPSICQKPHLQDATVLRHNDENTASALQSLTVVSREPAVEAVLGRKRCIMFSCGAKKDTTKPEVSKGVISVKAIDQDPEPPKRPCALRFACTVKDGPGNKNAFVTRHASPPPPPQRGASSHSTQIRAHRGSDSTVKNESPKSVRKSRSTACPGESSLDFDASLTEATRFHEFASAEEEVDEWTQESTCHRSRLTVSDTLVKENQIRRLGEEAEEEALADEEDLVVEETDTAGDDDDDDDDLEEADEDEEDNAEESQGDISDAGFQTDDEEGFAVSDDESDADPENQWWAPGRSTAATSADILDHIRPTTRRSASESSMSSRDSGRVAHSSSKRKLRRKSRALDILRPGTPELPDSTDFVCGTLAEDRPLEEAYISCMEQRRAANHKFVPQDIDPTFPTSDPDMEEDENDDDGVDGVGESDQHPFMHGNPDPHEERDTRGRSIVDIESDEERAPTDTGAITIRVANGLDKKRIRRKEKFYQQYCNKRDDERRPRPGKGAERMKKIGLELAAYKGNPEDVTSY
ncbi:hypothetical protein B0A49_08180 [Cryomyces minteri]|uniref:Uncharacterized protein n=1 Tax=Cryomyces minteri TaxID=331657 RepID=A0A4U0WTU6_9PEZI|nr:hypothetical protein B0A49_08180 [Cryomyces minteri]